jgi:hypothetical protein
VGADEIDLGLELLGVEALDTGRDRAVVVVDPKDRRRLKGFLYLASVYSEAIERAELDSPVARRLSTARPAGGPTRQVAERQTLQGLADRMTERTQVRVEVLDGLPLNDPRLLQVPFVLLTANAPFTVTAAEAANLGRYLTSGGFLWIENVFRPRAVGNSYTSDLPALRDLLGDALTRAGLSEGKDWRLARLDGSHPLYHCYYDIDGLPLGFWDRTYTGSAPLHYTPEYLEGIEVAGRLAGVYSQKDYADFWAGEAEFIRDADEAANLINGRFAIGGEELKPYDLGVNVLVFALTQEGSLARRLVAAE